MVYAVLTPLLKQVTVSVQTKQCITNLRKTSAGLLLYSDDHNNHLPVVDWMAAIRTYIDEPSITACPVQRRIDTSTFGYALAEGLPGKSMKDIATPSAAPLVFDSTDTRENAVAPVAAVPSPGRHSHGRENNVAYADGHVVSVLAK